MIRAMLIAVLMVGTCAPAFAAVIVIPRPPSGTPSSNPPYRRPPGTPVTHPVHPPGITLGGVHYNPGSDYTTVYNGISMHCTVGNGSVDCSNYR